MMELMNSVIQERLINYIKNVENEDFDELVKRYGKDGEQEFLENMELAVDSIRRLDAYDMNEIYHNLRDDEPFEVGVIINERITGKGRFRLIDAERGEHGEFIKAWVKETIGNPSYVDLFTTFFKCPEGMIDSDDTLSGLDLFYSTGTCTLITAAY